jgi:hypothetical protein
MLRFVQDDTELAFVISHELAHNLMKHLAAKSTNQIVGKVGAIGLAVLATAASNIGLRYATNLNPRLTEQILKDPTLDRNSFSEEFEAEADYVGLYMMARAGMNIDGAPQFWRRMGAAYPASNKSAFGASHPSDAYRMLALEAAIKQIKRKIEDGLPLVPDTTGSSLQSRAVGNDTRVTSPEKVPAPGVPYRITFLLDYRLSARVRPGQTLDYSGDPLEFEDRISRCLSKSMRRIAPSMSVTGGKEFRRVAFPALSLQEAPHTAESIVVLLGSPAFRQRIVPRGLRYFAVVKVDSKERFGDLPPWSEESRFSVSLIDVQGTDAPHREDAGAVRSKGSGHVFRQLMNPTPLGSIESQVCAEIGRRLGEELARRTRSSLPIRSDANP